jgi:hypothetical protein
VLSGVAAVPRRVASVHNFATSKVTLELAEGIKLRLGVMPETNANRLAAYAEGREILRRMTADKKPWDGMRTAHQRAHLEHAVQLAFVPDEAEINAARISRTRYNKRQKARYNGSSSWLPASFF